MSEANYADINNDRRYPPLTRVQSAQIAKAILRSHLGSRDLAAVRTYYAGNGQWVDRLPRRSELMRVYRRWTSGGKTGRRVWATTKPTTGHCRGWGRLIHDVSHIIHEYRHPKERPHGDSHHQIERDVQVFVELELLPRTVV